MKTKDGNSDRKIEEMVSQDQADELMHINTTVGSPAGEKLSEYGPEAGLAPETIEEKTADWTKFVQISGD